MKISKIELHPHQEDAIAKMHNGCVLTGDVGSGKTITSLAYALMTEPGKHIYVITTAKVRDSGEWERQAALLGVDADKFHIDSWNNVSKYAVVEDAIFILDEQRLVGTGMWVKSFYAIAAKNRWILLSATPGDTWLDYAPVFIANGFFKNITEFRNKHVVYDQYSKYPKVKKYLAEGRLIQMRRAVLVPMPMPRHTTRHVKTVEVGYDEETFERIWKQRWNVYEDQPIQDAGELFRVARKAVNSDTSRLEQVKALLRVHPKLIVFYNYNYELEQLRTLIPSDQKASPESVEQLAERINRQRMDGPAVSSSTASTSLRSDSMESETCGGDFAVAEWNGHKHENVPRTDSWLYLVQYTAGAEGWNCTTTDAMVFYSLTYSYKQFMQSQGRIDRMNTPFKDLYYYVLMSRAPSCKAVWRALQNKKDFNVRGFM